MDESNVPLPLLGIAPTLRDDESLLDLGDLELFKNAASEEMPPSPPPRRSIFRWGKNFDRDGGDKSSTPTLLASRGPLRGEMSSSMERPDKLLPPEGFRRARDVLVTVEDSVDSVESRLELTVLADDTACAIRVPGRLRAPLLLLRLRLLPRFVLLELRSLSSVVLELRPRVMESSVTDVDTTAASLVDLDRAGATRRDRCVDRELFSSLLVLMMTLADMLPRESLDRDARGTRRRLLRRDKSSICSDAVDASSAAVSETVRRLDLDDGVLGVTRRIRSRARAKPFSSNSSISSSDPTDVRECIESPRLFRARRDDWSFSVEVLSTLKDDMDCGFRVDMSRVVAVVVPVVRYCR